MNIFRKHHTFWFFHKYRRIINVELQIKEKYGIQGAYMLLKRFKDRLKVFDQTISEINKSKVNLTEFRQLESSIDIAHASKLFNDMKVLYDFSMKEIKAKMGHDRDEFSLKLLNIQRQTFDAFKK